jgi:hypothetical protein
LVPRIVYVIEMYMIPMPPSSNVTSMSWTVMRGSQRASELCTSKAARPAVRALAGANTRSWMPQPNSGRMGRSPNAVPRISRIDSRISACSVTSATDPVGSMRTGNARPEPMNSAAIS